MIVELRLRGAAERLATAAFDGYEVSIDGATTVVVGSAVDESEALGLINRAANVGLTVLSWRVIEQPRGDH